MYTMYLVSIGYFFWYTVARTTAGLHEQLKQPYFTQLHSPQLLEIGTFLVNWI